MTQTHLITDGWASLAHILPYLWRLEVWHGHIRSLNLHPLGTGNTLLGLAAGIEGSCVGAQKGSRRQWHLLCPAYPNNDKSEIAYINVALN